MKKLLLILCVLFAAGGVIAQDDEPEYKVPEDCTSENGPVFYYDRGYGFYNSADYESALLDFSCAASLDDTYRETRHMRGLMFELLERPEEAYTAFAEVIEIDPEYEISYIGLGNAALELDNYDEAVDHFSTYIELDAENPLVYYSRAIAYHELEDYQAAVEDYSEAIRLDPQYSHAYGGRASAYNGLGDYEAAIADVEKAFRIELSDVSWMYPIMMTSYFNMGEYEEAQAVYNDYLDIETEPSSDIQEIVDELENCWVTASDNVNRRLDAGTTYQVLGILSGGESAFVDAKRTDSEGFVWWRLEDNAGWVRSDTVTENEACDSLTDITPS